jgi:hypothetical protein
MVKTTQARKLAAEAERAAKLAQLADAQAALATRRDALIDAVVNEFSSKQALIALAKELGEDNARQAVFTARFMISLGIAKDEATMLYARIANKTTKGDGADLKPFTKAQNKASGAARLYWMKINQACGWAVPKDPNAPKNGGARNTKDAGKQSPDAPKVTLNDAVASENEVVRVPSATAGTEDVRKWISLVASQSMRAVNAHAKALDAMGDKGSALRSAITEFNRAVKAAIG